MLSILSKPREQVTPTDVQELVATRAQENETLEFKAGLPAENGKSDPWSSGHDKISNYAKKKLLDESVAFANAYGGTLVIGIAERKGVAAQISAVPRCKELAERLRLVFRDCIDPQLPHVEIFGVETQSDAGVVIVRAPKSRLAPHRNKKTLQCPIRRSDRCEPMTMREIQDTTLNLSRGFQRIEEALAQRSRAFAKQFDRIFHPYGIYGLRFTGIPVMDDVRFEKLLHQHGLHQRFKPPSVELKRYLLGKAAKEPLLGVKSIYAPNFTKWRPRLRAAHTEYSHQKKSKSEDAAAILYRELGFHGMVEMGILSIDSEFEDPYHTHPLHQELPVVEFAALAVWADQVRAEAGTPAAEYVIDVEIVTKGRPCHVINSNTRERLVVCTLPMGSTSFPRYSLGDVEQFPQLLKDFEQDFLNACGLVPSDTHGDLRIVAP